MWERAREKSWDRNRGSKWGTSDCGEKGEGAGRVLEKKIKFDDS